MGTCTPESRLHSDDDPPSPPTLPIPPKEEDRDEFIPRVELEEEDSDDKEEREDVRVIVALLTPRFPSEELRGSSTEDEGGGERRECELSGVLQ